MKTIMITASLLITALFTGCQEATRIGEGIILQASDIDKYGYGGALVKHSDGWMFNCVVRYPYIDKQIAITNKNCERVK